MLVHLRIVQSFFFFFFFLYTSSLSPFHRVKNITMLRLRILAIQDRKQLTEKEKLDLEAAKEQLAGTFS